MEPYCASENSGSSGSLHIDWHRRCAFLLCWCVVCMTELGQGLGQGLGCDYGDGMGLGLPIPIS